MLTDLLARATAMPVVEAEDGMPVETDRVFVIPPDSTLTLKDRCLQISRPAPPRERRRPIDTFFSSLADDQGENAVCIVLARTGSDGTLGLKTVKENGGLTMAQAEFDHTAMSGMPHSATATGLVDHVLPAGEMPAKLLEYRDHLHKVAGRKDGDGTRVDTAEHLAPITALLRAKTGHDFSKYKEKTLVRRIQRRMQVLQTDTVPAYLARLREEPRQIELLFRELLIGVTQFFRDAEAFDSLSTAVISPLVERKSPDDVVRIWIPACATGEEVYSIAILLKEKMERQGRALKVQIFGTDIDDNAVAFARSGRYRKTTGVSAERLKRWFAEVNDEFCPMREVRELCVFSLHSVLRDPPFSKLDLLSCRNMLIYMDPALQERVLRTFHYALNPGGTLFLGPSEGVGRQGKLFAAIDKKPHIFRRSDADATFSALPLPGSATQPPAHIGGAPAAQAAEDRIDKSARRALAKYSPAYLVVDRHHNVLRFSGGEAGRYLEPSPDAASLGLFTNLRKSLRPIVRAAFAAAVAANGAARDEATITIDGRRHALTVMVEPISAGDREERLFVVAFREDAALKAGGPPAAKDDDEEVRAIEHELRTTRAQLQATIDELERPTRR